MKAPSRPKAGAVSRTLFQLIAMLLLLWCCVQQPPPAITPAPALDASTANPAATGPAPTTDAGTLARLQGNENMTYLEIDGQAAYRVGPGDVLEIVSWEGMKPIPQETIVRQDGRISFSFLDDIDVAGLSVSQIDDLLSERLARYVKKVRLDITVKTFLSKHALLFGEIHVLPLGKTGPGKYPLRGKTSILDLIVEAGGGTENADLKNVELVRSGQRYTLNLYDAMFKGDTTYNVILDHNDMVTVPKLPELSERIYVFGEVAREGVYPFNNSMNLLTAIGQAGGCTRTAVKDSIKIIRGYADNKPVVLGADLDLLLRGGDIRQNIELHNGDVVFVPRTFIGDINEFIIKTTPMLDYLFYPGRLRDTYTNPDSLRVLTK